MLDDFKGKWKDIVIILLIISNLFLMYSMSKIKNDIYNIEGEISSLEGNLDNLKNDVSTLETEVGNNSSDIGNIFDVLQNMEHMRLFGY